MKKKVLSGGCAAAVLAFGLAVTSCGGASGNEAAKQEANAGQEANANQEENADKEAGQNGAKDGAD